MQETKERVGIHGATKLCKQQIYFERRTKEMRGLTNVEVLDSRRKYGSNKLPEPKQKKNGMILPKRH